MAASASSSSSLSVSSPAGIAADSPALAAALASHRQGALDAAQQAYEHILASPQTSSAQAASAHHWLGVLHLQQQRAPLARACFEKALTHAPANFASQLNLGHARLQMGDATGAFTAYDAASLAPEPDIAAAAFAAIAHAHMHRGASDTALAALDRAIALQPDVPAFHDSRGSVLNVLGHYAEAEQAHRAALARQPAHPGFHNNLGLAVKAQGRVDDAIWHFRDALRRDPDYVPALINLGQAVAMRGDYDQASAPLTRAVAIAPGNAAAHHELGNVFAAMADYDSALTHYTRAVALAPDAALAWQNLGATRFELGDQDAAGEAFEKALAINPTLALARFNLASIHLAQGHWRDGWTAYEARLAVWHALPPDRFVMQSGQSEQSRTSCTAVFPGVRWRGTQPPHPAAHRQGVDSSTNPVAYDEPTDQATRADASNQGYFSLREKCILVHAEQGLGDTIQFFRFCGQVATQAKQVILLLPANLCALLAPAAAAMGNNLIVLSMADDNASAYAHGKIDCHCPLLSLPLALGITSPDALLNPASSDAPASHPAPAVPPYLAAPSNKRSPPQWTSPSPAPRRGAKTRLLAKRAVNRIAHMARLTRITRAGRLSRASLPAAPRTMGAHAAHTAPPVVHKVGLVWSGKRSSQATLALSIASPHATENDADGHHAETPYPTYPTFDKRAIPLDAMQPLFDLPNIEWHVLQTEITREDADALADLMTHYPIIWRSREFQDFADTAQALNELDHVVSIDTSVAHLAGAMGWPVSVMLPLAADWRWADVAEAHTTAPMQRQKDGVLVHATSCGWYPSVRMFKQVARDDWAPVVDAVAQSLVKRFKLDVAR